MTVVGEAARRRAALPLLLLLLPLAACRQEPSNEADELFRKVPTEESGVTFVNELPESDGALNIISYLYYYDGGGVAAGDVNGDGLVDLFFTANVGPNRLYLNRDGLKFEDVTEQAGVAGTGNWKTGATMADVNGDGHLDIYVAAVDGLLDRKGVNQLFVNGGDGTFTERAAEYGLDFRGFGTHAAFFDYDRDGDLDAYLVNHSVHGIGTYGKAELREQRHLQAGDRLLRNEGGRFVDVSEQAGIYGGVVGYGLSATVSDLNVDGWPDLYVANDFHENDYLYYNNGDGTFREAIREAMPHTSRSSMGSDAADVNNDGRPDVAVLDMLPDREDILKTSDDGETFDLYNLKVSFGYHHQVTRNTLQLNQGQGRFSDVALLAGVEATDWSWAPLLADLDLDGFNDLFVTNGIYRRPNDLDYISHVSQGTVQASLNRNDPEALAAAIRRMPQVRIPNYAFRNGGDLTFTNQAAAWGLDDTAFSAGAAYADLDNDGDLDLVTNNINEPASIFENRAETLEKRHLTVVLEGEGGNTAGIGARVVARAGGRLVVREQVPTRGFQSSVDPRLHFGLDTLALVDTLTVVWPDGRFQKLAGVPTDTTLTLRQSDAGGLYVYPKDAPASPLFHDVTDALGIGFRHAENTFTDFNRERLMPHLLSREGPALAVADVNGDGLDDVYLGGARWQAGRLLLQAPGGFRPADEATWRADSLHEDVDAAFFDADGDGDQDLLAVSGGNEFWGQAEALRPRLYLNDSRGGFTRSPDALPGVHVNGSVAAPADFDGDGDVDVFIGGRSLPHEYGMPPRSYLLENDGRGAFRDVTEARARGLSHAGMVTDAAWADTDGDGQLDLILVGEWMPVTVFAQERGGFTARTEAAGLGRTNGWWHALLARDLDGDGDVDLVAGNLGLNAKPKAQPNQPARLYVKDFDGNGSLDPVFTYYKHGVSYPAVSRDQLVWQIEPLRKQFVSYASYGASRIEDVFTAEQLKGAEVREAHTFTTTYLENDGAGTFTSRALPIEAQIAPVYAILPGDFNGDGQEDLLLGGNFTATTPALGRYDASYGTLLLGDGHGGFTPLPSASANLYLSGEVRAMQVVRGPNGRRFIVAARNHDTPQVLRIVEE